MQGAAHCAEFATDGAEIDLNKANECRRCYAKIGDWGTEAGFAQGQECLNTYEPSFTELCGEKMTAFQVEFFNLGIDIDLQYTIFGENAYTCHWQALYRNSTFRSLGSRARTRSARWTSAGRRRS